MTTDLVVKALGWAGQAAFAWRTLDQWIASEKAKQTVVPRGFWTWSLVGTALSLAYNLAIQDKVFVLGAVATGCIFARNAAITSRGKPTDPGATPPLWPLLLGLLLFGGMVVFGALAKSEPVPLAWSVLAFAGQTAWSGRFVAQWWTSEHRGRSVLPASFFVLGLVGTLLLLAYAIERSDWVNIAAYAPNALPYGRNLWILRHAKRGG